MSQSLTRILDSDHDKDDIVNIHSTFELNDNWEYVDEIIIHEASRFNLKLGDTGFSYGDKPTREMQFTGRYADVHAYGSYLDRVRDSSLSCRLINSQ